jgi:hypothetical protein
MQDAATVKLDAGSSGATIKIYTGTQPANADTALSGNTLLATLTMTDPAGPASSSGTFTASAITEDAAADATGTATFARVADSAGVTVFDCTVGTSGEVVNLNTVSIVTGGPVRITSCTLSIPA